MPKTAGTNIWLSLGEKEDLQIAKRAIEQYYKRKMDWGQFLISLATGQISVAITARAINNYRGDRVNG